MFCVPKLHHAVKAHAIGATKNDHVSVFDRDPLSRRAAMKASKEEMGWNAERDGNDGRLPIAFVEILMKRETGPRPVMVDEAGIGSESAKTRFGSGEDGELAELCGHRRP